MRAVVVVAVLALPAACKSGPKEPPAQPAAAPLAQTPAAAESRTPAQVGTATLLIKELPPGTEGLELKTNGLAIADGYELVGEAGGKFSVRRKRDGESVASGGCGCTGGTCEPTLSGGVIVCSGTSCTDTCGLALTTAGVRFEVAKF
jgi:hypothetical protein